MTIYRIDKESRSDFLTGEGAHLYGGRWNNSGIPVIYASLNRATTYMEALVNWTLPGFPKKRVIVEIEIPDSIVISYLSEILPMNWDTYPYIPFTQTYGDNWLKACSSLCLKVPSAAVADEWNLLINPAHPEFNQINVIDVKPAKFNKRLLKIHS